MLQAATPSIAVDPEIERLARAGAWFVTSASGGKDSGAAADASWRWLDGIGHPRDRRLMLHADLGRAEWGDTLDTVRAVAAHIGWPLEVVSAPKDLVWRFEDRWRRSLLRYAALETIALVPPWSSSNSLFCRSEQKTVILSRRKARLPGDLPVVGIMGIRREESPGRSKAPVSAPDSEMQRRNGRQGVLWNPIVDWRVDQVFAHHEAHAIPLHRAYGLTCSRVSCALCTLSSLHDQRISVTTGGNIAQYRTYVSLEIRSAFPFQPNRWLADLLDDGQTDPHALAEAKRMAAERKRLQSEIPTRLLKAKTVAGITPDEAEALAAARSAIATLYGIAAEGTTASAIMRISRGLA